QSFGDGDAGISLANRMLPDDRRALFGKRIDELFVNRDTVAARPQNLRPVAGVNRRAANKTSPRHQPRRKSAPDQLYCDTRWLVRHGLGPNTKSSERGMMHSPIVSER